MTAARRARRGLLGRLCMAPWLLPAATPGASAATPPTLEAPNVVPIDERLVTAGQPGPRALAALGSQGFEAVIYLAPASVPDAVQDEPALLARQGIRFVHIPIPFDAPDASHLEALATALQGLAAQKVLVHCQVNMRASTMVFLYRVLHRREDPARAYEAVARVWSPNRTWRRFVVQQLALKGIAFEPY